MCLSVTGVTSIPNLSMKANDPFKTPSDLDVLQMPSYLDLAVSKYWQQLVTESTQSRPLISQPHLLHEHSYQVSIATETAAEEIAELVVTAFSKGDVFRKVGQRRTSTNEVIEDMHTPYNRWYIVTVNKVIVAAMLYISESKNEASVNMLSAHPNFWGLRLGVYLCEKAEAVAKQQGKTQLNLSAAQTNLRLIKYYERLGFKKIRDQEEEYFSPELQKEYLTPEYQGYEPDGRAKLRNYDMAKILSE